MLILRLALPTPLRRLFDYLPPEPTTQATDMPPVEQLQPGIRVKVPFGNRELIGLLIEVDQHSDIAGYKLKHALEILDSKPPLPDHLFALARWAAGYYHHPEGDALHQALPVLLRKGAPCEYAHAMLWRPCADARLDNLAANAKRQRETLSILQGHPDGLSSDAVRAEGGDSTALRKLAEKGLAEQFEYIPASHQPPNPAHLLREPALPLNVEQQEAVDAIGQATHFQPFLLEGVTGSGKTEVYLQIIHAVLSQGKQALILVPEIGLTPQTLARFKARFNLPVVALHSNMSDRQRLDAWLKARDGAAPIVIGTRSALFTALKSPGVLIIDEEHDASFKQQDGFRYSARDLAIARAHREQIPVVLGSATPSLETLHNATTGRYQHLRLTQRAGNARPPVFELLDTRQAALNDGLSTALKRQIADTLHQGNQVLVFINRRGFAPSLSCQSCGHVIECRRCDAHMTLHMKPPHLHCHHCDSQRPIPPRCPECGSDELKAVGSGTERTEQTLEQQFPDTTVLRVDRDSTARKDALEKIMRQVHTGEPCILVGTQMLAKGHHFPDVTLVAILNADGGLFSADFRGMERTAQLIEQVAGRAGRADKPGKVVMQTMHADHPAINRLVHDGYAAFARDELETRRLSQLPPFQHIALLKAEASRQGSAEAFLRAVREYMEQNATLAPHSRFVGPFPSTMEKKAGVFRAQLQLQSAQRADLHRSLHALCQLMETQPEARKVRWVLDVDPLEV